MTRAIAIESLDDPRVAGYRNVRDRELRGRDGLFIVESVKVVERLVRSPFEVSSVLLSRDREDALGPAVATLPVEVPVYAAERELLHAISGYHVHGGALALAKRPAATALRPVTALRAALEQESTTLVACAGVTHMDNIGSIFRAAAGLGADGVLLDGRCCDPLLRKAIRVSMGHVLTMPFASTDDMPAVLAWLRADHGVHIVALESNEHPSLAGRAVPLACMRRAARVALVVGSEGHGLDDALLRIADQACEIPMRPGVPSLNVAMAATIALYERSRQRGDVHALASNGSIRSAPPEPPPAPCWG